MTADEAQPLRIDEELLRELHNERASMKQITDTFHEQCDFLTRFTKEGFSFPALEAQLKSGAPLTEVHAVRVANVYAMAALRGHTALVSGVGALNEGRLHSFALETRSLLETAAFAAYHAARLAVPESAVKPPADYDARVLKALKGSRFDWEKLLASQDGGPRLIEAYAAAKKPRELEPTEPAVNVMTMVEALADRVGAHHESGRGAVLLNYAMLSDMCHPAFGSHFLFFRHSTESNFHVELGSEPVVRSVLAHLLVPSMAMCTNSLIGAVADLEDASKALRAMKS